ncbi:MAG: transaldolase [Alphaproteobacteria bacterium]|nr:transaldolase [Alphaproteobacteria bacterium]
MDISKLRVKIFADGAELDQIEKMAADPMISGFTTNPTLMRKAGVTDYTAFARDALAVVGDKPISFEVFADDLPTMGAQAREIASWGDNVFVKIPITNTQGQTAVPLVRELSGEGVQVNVTAMFTLQHVEDVADALDADTAAVVSVFAGRIADAGTDPVPLMRDYKQIVSAKPKAELLWASPREVLNLIQAEETGCDIITMAGDQLAKLASLGKDLDQFSLETVAMFYKDAQASGFDIPIGADADASAA